MALAKAVTFTGLCQAGEDGIQRPGDPRLEGLLNQRGGSPGAESRIPMILYHNLGGSTSVGPEPRVAGFYPYQCFSEIDRLVESVYRFNCRTYGEDLRFATTSNSVSILASCVEVLKCDQHVPNNSEYDDAPTCLYSCLVSKPFAPPMSFGTCPIESVFSSGQCSPLFGLWNTQK